MIPYRFLGQRVEVVFSNKGDVAHIGTGDRMSDLLVFECSEDA
jgi:hypothetical protein